MKQKIINGYVVQLYQYARRYRYNNNGCLQLFNRAIDRRKKRHAEEYTLENEFLTFGDFDLLQIIGVDSFRKYHDVSELAKDWLGKRQSVLLYDIAEEENPVRIYFDERQCVWRHKKNGQDINTKFFCLSMFSFTNEIVEYTEDILGLLQKLRCRILSIADELNEAGICKIECEVFGTFNTSELGIVWLSDQYVDILQVMDYVKHIEVRDTGCLGSEQAKTVQAFFTSFSVIAIKETTESAGVRGNALIQIAVHDIMEKHGQIRQLARCIAGNEDQDENVFCSVGEYDLMLTVSAARAIELIKYDGLLGIGKHDEKERGKFDVDKYRPVLRNNIRLVYHESQTQELKNKLEELSGKGKFIIRWEKEFKPFSHMFDWKELDESIDLPAKWTDINGMDIKNADYFQYVRQKLKKYVSSSAGAVDTLDLLYSDYHSTVAVVYNAMWVSDLHRQFKAVLHAIDCLISPDILGWSWNQYRDLTNVFKQQIYHLTQANRLFFEVPSCHLRATGLYDFLMHSYYGVSKKILECIYLMQGKDAQSELVLLITVNTVPQVKTQIYFEIGSSDDSRVINLDIPNSIIFNLQRGIWYLTHELFHYAAPWNRADRNYNMALFLLAFIFRKQFLHVFCELLSTRVDGTIEEETKTAMNQLIVGSTVTIEGLEQFYEKFDDAVLDFVCVNFESDIQPYIKAAQHELNSNYQREVYRFAEEAVSRSFFQKLFVNFFPEMCKRLLKIVQGANAVSKKDAFSRIEDRIKYCQRDPDYVERYIKSDYLNRIHDYKLNRHTWVAKDRWSMVREACSDVAMVSLNGLGMEDYMLFCIQAWTDASNDKTNVLEEMRKRYAEKEWGRFALVAEYFFTRSQEGWNRVKPDYEVPEDRVKKEFSKQYIWYYAGKKMKNPDPEKQNEIFSKFKQLSDEADSWMRFFAECIRYFSINLSAFFDDVLVKVLADFDIKNRISLLKQQNRVNCDEYVQRLELIRQQFKEYVYKPYSKLFQQIPDDYREFFPENAPVRIAEYDSRYKDLRFKQDIYTAHYFQNQISFQELENINKGARNEAKQYSYAQIEKKKTNTWKKAEYDKNVWKFHVHSLTELLFYMRFSYEQLSKAAESSTYQIGQRKSPKIWFRGHTSEKYKHVPTVMRNFKGTARERYQSLRNYQQSNFEEFKFRADGAPEMPKGLRFTKSDYIAMMQHYGTPSNFLDWTENAFTSLYLALKYYYDIPAGSDEAVVNRNVTFSIFHPGIYNHIRRDSLKEFSDTAREKIRKNSFISRMMSRENGFVNLIPNLSVSVNEENFSMFLLGNADDDRDFLAMRDLELAEYQKACRNEMKALFMPMAVLTSRLNERIRTQCGCFVAYHLYAPLDMSETLDDRSGKSHFDYLSLEKIQEEKKDRGIFLYQITIDKECCRDVVNWLKSLGVSRENVYPELSEKTFD